MNRETYLTTALDALRPWFADRGHALPDRVLVSIGWPSTGGTSRKRRRVGECWHATDHTGNAPHIFVSPVHASPYGALDTLAHELCHVVAPAGAKHGPKFVRVTKDIGLTEGRPTSASAGGALAERLNVLAGELGDYPHVPIDPQQVAKPQSTRLIKATCEQCGYTVRVTRKWLDHSGPPLCPGCYGEDGRNLSLVEG